MKFFKTGKTTAVSNVTWGLILIALLAIAVRLWGLNYDLPYIYHPDEPGYIVRSQSIFKTGDLNPHFFNYPSFMFYLNALAYVPYYAAGKLAGVFGAPSDILPPTSLAMGVTYAPMPTAVLLNRLVTLVFGVGVVLVTFGAGRRLTGSTAVALLASLFVAISPTNVFNSRQVTPDTFVTFWVIVGFYGAILIYKQGETRHYLLAGISVGLAAASKYNGGLIILAVVAAHLLRHGKASLKQPRIYFALLTSGLAFLIASPYVLLDYSKFMTDFLFEAEHYATGHAGMEGDTLNWYIGYLWKTTGPVLLLAASIILWAFFRRSKEIILLSVFPASYFLFISRFPVRNDRTILPLTPFLFLLAAEALVLLFRQSNRVRDGRKKAVRTLVIALTLLAIFMPARMTIIRSLKLGDTNSRETARVWIADNLPPSSRIAIESYAPFVDPSRFNVRGFVRLINHQPSWYFEQEYDYLIFSQWMFGRFYLNPERYAQEVSQYDAFFNGFQFVKSFDDGGFEIRIYQTAGYR